MQMYEACQPDNGGPDIESFKLGAAPNIPAPLDDPNLSLLLWLPLSRR